jgi:hypothetical protein
MRPCRSLLGSSLGMLLSGWDSCCLCPNRCRHLAHCLCQALCESAQQAEALLGSPDAPGAGGDPARTAAAMVAQTHAQVQVGTGWLFQALRSWPCCHVPLGLSTHPCASFLCALGCPA